MTYKELRDELNKMDEFTLAQEAKIGHGSLRVLGLKQTTPENGVWLDATDEWPNGLF